MIIRHQDANAGPCYGDCAHNQQSDNEHGCVYTANNVASNGNHWPHIFTKHLVDGVPVESSVLFSVRGETRYSRYMPNSGAKRSTKMITIHNLQELKAAAHGSDPQTKLLVLGLGEAIVTTCGQARMFLEEGSMPRNQTNSG